MSLFSKLFGSSQPQKTALIIPDAAPAGDIFGMAVTSVVKNAGGNCATLECVSNPAKWIQIMDHSINCHYPHHENPTQLYPELVNHPIVADLEEFEGECFMLVSLNEMKQAEIVDWLEQYFCKVLSVDLLTDQIRLRMEQL